MLVDHPPNTGIKSAPHKLIQYFTVDVGIHITARCRLLLRSIYMLCLFKAPTIRSNPGATGQEALLSIVCYVYCSGNEMVKRGH